MREVDRRKFLIASGVTGAAGIIAGAAGVTWEELMKHPSKRPAPVVRAATATAPSGPSGPLVLVTLYGGNDGLGTLIPHSNSALERARPGMLYPSENLNVLDDTYALNPGLTAMAQRWKNGQVAIVRGVGYPKPDHSHFRSMDIWQTASPSSPLSSGWIGRWLDTGRHEALRALNLGTTLPPLAVGMRSTAAALSLDDIPPLAGPMRTAANTLAVARATDGASYADVRSNYADEHTAAIGLRTVEDAPHPGIGLEQQLVAVATCIKEGLAPQAYLVSQGGFDTHAGELPMQQSLLRSVDAAIDGFFHTLQGSVHGQNAVVMLYSEFGRRVAANSAQGTDHGTAGPVFLIGNSVRGGYHGEEPSLTDLDNGDLRFTTDFRRVYAEMLSGVLHADPDPILGGSYEPLGLLA